MNKIQSMVDHLIGVEGGYANNPNDAGGETIWGITVAVARANGYTGAMRDMPREEAAAIYLRQYFIAPGFDKVSAQSEAVAEELFDTGVNMGVSVASRFLQRALNVLNRSHKTPLYPDIAPDGRLGARSIEALGVFLRARGPDGEKVLLRMLNSLQGSKYIEITENRVQNEEFLYGWFLNRVVI